MVSKKDIGDIEKYLKSLKVPELKSIISEQFDGVKKSGKKNELVDRILTNSKGDTDATKYLQQRMKSSKKGKKPVPKTVKGKPVPPAGRKKSVTKPITDETTHGVEHKRGKVVKKKPQRRKSTEKKHKPVIITEIKEQSVEDFDKQLQELRKNTEADIKSLIADLDTLSNWSREKKDADDYTTVEKPEFNNDIARKTAKKIHKAEYSITLKGKGKTQGGELTRLSNERWEELNYRERLKYDKYADNDLRASIVSELDKLRDPVVKLKKGRIRAVVRERKHKHIEKTIAARKPERFTTHKPQTLINIPETNFEDWVSQPLNGDSTGLSYNLRDSIKSIRQHSNHKVERLLAGKSSDLLLSKPENFDRMVGEIEQIFFDKHLGETVNDYITDMTEFLSGLLPAFRSSFIKPIQDFEVGNYNLGNIKDFIDDIEDKVNDIQIIDPLNPQQSNSKLENDLELSQKVLRDEYKNAFNDFINPMGRLGGDWKQEIGFLKNNIRCSRVYNQKGDTFTNYKNDTIKYSYDGEIYCFSKSLLQEHFKNKKDSIKISDKVTVKFDKNFIKRLTETHIEEYSHLVTDDGEKFDLKLSARILPLITGKLNAIEKTFDNEEPITKMKCGYCKNVVNKDYDKLYRDGREIPEKLQELCFTCYEKEETHKESIPLPTRVYEKPKQMPIGVTIDEARKLLKEKREELNKIIQLQGQTSKKGFNFQTPNFMKQFASQS